MYKLIDGSENKHGSTMGLTFVPRVSGDPPHFNKFEFLVQ